MRVLLAVVVAGSAAVPAFAQMDMDEDDSAIYCFRWKIVESLQDGTVRCKCSCSPFAPYCCS